MSTEKKSPLPIKMTAEEYQTHEEELNGICLACGAIREGDTEGDAEGYPCDECGEDKVQGIQNALIDENIVFED